MAIVCDTSPLSYLVLIDEIDLLADLYGEVAIPPAVAEELRHPDSPEATRQWISAPPQWLYVSSPASRSLNEITASENPTFHTLDRGEREAIRLAVHEEARLLVIDERAGRAVANDLGLNITGTLGVLGVAAIEGLVDAAEVVDRLRATSFRATPSLYRWLLSRHEHEALLRAPASCVARRAHDPVKSSRVSSAPSSRVCRFGIRKAHTSRRRLMERSGING